MGKTTRFAWASLKEAYADLKTKKPPTKKVPRAKTQTVKVVVVQASAMKKKAKKKKVRRGGYEYSPY